MIGRTYVVYQKRKFFRVSLRGIRDVLPIAGENSIRGNVLY